MQVKAIAVSQFHPIDGESYITLGKVYDVVEVLHNGRCDIIDDTGELITTCYTGPCSHRVTWEVVDAS